MSKNERYRSMRFEIRLFPEEMEILTAKADRLGISKSDYIRDIILYGEIRKGRSAYESPEFKKLLYEMNRIGNSINQVAYNSHLKKSTGQEEIGRLKEDYNTLLCFVEELLLFRDEPGRKTDGDS